MKVKLLSSGAQIPQRATKNSAGYDLYAPKDTVINPGRNIVPLDIAVAIPTNMEGQIRPRSGFSTKGMEGYPLYGYHSISGSEPTSQRYNADVILGTIDSDYRGCVGVIVKSEELDSFVIAKGTRIAQLVVSAYYSSDIEIAEELDDTDRAEGGFGHSGTK